MNRQELDIFTRRVLAEAASLTDDDVIPHRDILQIFYRLPSEHRDDIVQFIDDSLCVLGTVVDGRDFLPLADNYPDVKAVFLQTAHLSHAVWRFEELMYAEEPGISGHFLSAAVIDENHQEVLYLIRCLFAVILTLLPKGKRRRDEAFAKIAKKSSESKSQLMKCYDDLFAFMEDVEANSVGA